jgi:hypothetical protein
MLGHYEARRTSDGAPALMAETVPGPAYRHMQVSVCGLTMFISINARALTRICSRERT